MELSPDIHLLPSGPAAFTGVYAPNVYLVAGGEAALIDSGLNESPAQQRRLEYIQRHIQGRLKYVLITHGHPDHLGGALFLTRALGGEVVAHWSEEERLKKALDGGRCRLVAGGERLPLGESEIEVIATPGHCPGHLCYLLPGKGDLFSGDHVPGRGTTVVIPPRGDMSLYLDSLRRLLGLGLQMVLPGHGPAIPNPRQKIGELIEHRLAREAQVMALLGQRDWTTEELVQEVYPELDRRLEAMARGQLLAHLIKLRNEGQAEHRGARWALAACHFSF